MCIFCDIIEGKIKANIVYEDDLVIAFKDIQPQAPVHILIVPKKHIERIEELDDEKIAFALINAIKILKKKMGVEDFRIVVNSGAQAGQTVFHLHWHFLAGRQMNWPPG